MENTIQFQNFQRPIWKSSNTKPLPEGMSNAATTLFQPEIDLWNGFAKSEGKSRNEVFREALRLYAETRCPNLAAQIDTIRETGGHVALLAIFTGSIALTALTGIGGDEMTRARRTRGRRQEEAIQVEA